MNKRKTFTSLAIIIPLFALMIVTAPFNSASAHGLPDQASKVAQRKHHHKEPTAEQKAQREAVMAAIKANDYAKFKELTANKPFAQQIDAEAFAKLVKAEQLRTAGDIDGAKALLKEVIKEDLNKQGKEAKPYKKHFKKWIGKPWNKTQEKS